MTSIPNHWVHFTLGASFAGRINPKKPGFCYLAQVQMFTIVPLSSQGTRKNFLNDPIMIICRAYSLSKLL